MQEGGGAKQQIVEKIKSSTNIMVTVSADPSVDALSAALGLTLMLNKMDKHATAVFSGAVPPAIQFLEPEKTFEGTVDSLRDFIIALDKEKADRLRYKVDGDMVRIFITPYRTNISEKDLEFSQGEFNVEAIIALGVEKREELDAAIAQHGRILHDATVMTINAQEGTGNLGAIDWQDTEASSLCEMLMSLSEALQTGLVDEQIATSLLTGIVAATDRFSNEHTKPRVMTMAAQLMAAGANQQLIATKLQDSHIIKPAAGETPEKPATNNDGSTNLKENASTKVNRDDKKEKGKGEAAKDEAQKSESDEKKEPPKKKTNDGEMQIDHAESGDDAQSKKKNKNKPLDSATAGMTPDEITAKKQDDAVNAAEGALADALPMSPQSSTLADLERELKKEGQSEGQDQSSSQATPTTSTEANQPAQEKPGENKENSGAGTALSSTPPSWMGHRVEPPTMGGTLNATSEEALQNKLRAEEEDRKHAILSHGDRPVNEGQAPSAPANTPAAELPQVSPPPAAPGPDQSQTSQPPASPAPDNASAGDSSAGDVTAARDAVSAALNDSATPQAQVPNFGSAPTPPAEGAMPDYEATPAPSPYATPYSPQAGGQPQPPVSSGQGSEGDSGAPTPPPPPPMPDMNNLPPLPPTPPSGAPQASPPQTPAAPQSPPPNDPNAGGLPPTQNSRPDPFGPPPLDNSGNNPPTGDQPSSEDPGQFKIPGQ